MKEMVLPMDLQFFAADPAGSAETPATGADVADTAGKTGQDATGGTGQDATGQAEDKTDPAGDGKESTVDSQGGNLAEDVQKLVQEEMKKASMSPEEKAKYEAEEKEKSLKERESAISLRERTADAKELLSENGLPAAFTSMVLGADKAEMEKNVKALKAEFDRTVQAQVEKRLGGKTPEAGSGVSGNSGDSTLDDIIYSCL